LRLGSAGLILFVVVFILAFVIEIENPQTADFPEPQVVDTPTETVERVSGATYKLDENDAGWEAIQLSFEEDWASMQLTIEGQSYEFDIGFEGQYLPNASGSAETMGFWRSDEDFVVYYRQDDGWRDIWDIKFFDQDKVLFRLRDGEGVILQERFTGKCQS
jgi:hypothetical protein